MSEALIHEKFVERRGDSYYVVNFPGLIRYILDGKTWKDIGLPQLFGKIAIHSRNNFV